MRWSHESSPGWVFVTRMIGFISFLIFVALANILTSIYPQSTHIANAVSFLNANLPLLIIIAILMIVADILSAFPFPLDLPAPIIRAFGAVFIIAFLLALVQWLDFSQDISNMFQILSFFVVPLVFLIVLIGGYYKILKSLFQNGRANGPVPSVTDPTIGTPAFSVPATTAKSWDDVHAEFRMMLWDLFHRLREEMGRK